MVGKVSLQRGAVRSALTRLLEEDPKTLFIGEDIGVYGGAFQVSAGLHRKFGDQVIETPISESGICGLSIGLSLAGFKPILEIMFMDFAAQIVDQMLNQAVKFSGMYDNQLSVPLLVRTPAGGYRGYGPTHSQSLENLFASVHDLKIVYPYSIQDYYSCLLYLVHNLTSPVLFIENKSLYLKKGLLDKSIERAPGAVLAHKGEKVLFVSYGQAIDTIYEAMARANANWSVIDLVSLKPLVNFDLVLEQVKNHDRVVLVAESASYASVLEHVAFSIQKEAFGDLRGPVSIVSSKDVFIPARPDMEASTLLSPEDILTCLGEC